MSGRASLPRRRSRPDVREARSEVATKQAQVERQVNESADLDLLRPCEQFVIPDVNLSRTFTVNAYTHVPRDAYRAIPPLVLAFCRSEEHHFLPHVLAFPVPEGRD